MSLRVWSMSVVCVGVLLHGCEPQETVIIETHTSGPDVQVSSGEDAPAATPDVPSVEDTGGEAPKPSGLPDISAFVPAGPVTRNASCNAPSSFSKGENVPWKGFIHDGKTYTCNRCPGGDEPAQGEWRFVDFDTEDPETKLNDNYKELLIFEGSTWRQHSSGLDLGQQTDAWIEGYYFCGDVAEIPDQKHVFVVTRVEPEGAFGWQEGLVFTGKLYKQGTDKLAFEFQEGFLTGKLGVAMYCRPGTMVNTYPDGPAGKAVKKLCPHPFGG